MCSVRSFRPSMPYMICRLEVAAPAGHRLEHEGEVLEGLPVEAQAVERAQHEGRVPDPGVAVVPVAGPARRLGQRGGGRRHDGAGGGVAQTLERQRAALHVAAPGMVGERAVGQPVPPVGDGVVELGLRLVQVGGRGRPTTGRRRPSRPSPAWSARSSGPGRCRGGWTTSWSATGSPAGGRTVMSVAVAVVCPTAGLDAVLEDGDARWPPPRPGPRCSWPGAAGSRWRRRRPGPGGSRAAGTRPPRAATTSRSWTSSQPVGVCQVVSSTMVPGT